MRHLPPTGGSLCSLAAVSSAAIPVSFRLNTGDVITTKASQKVTKLVRLKQTSFFEILNKKFIDR